MRSGERGICRQISVGSKLLNLPILDALHSVSCLQPFSFKINIKEKQTTKKEKQTTKIVASSPVTSWQIIGKKVEAVTDFIFLGSKIIVDSKYSHEIKRCLLLGRKTMTNLDSVLKSRGIALLTKVCVVKGIVFAGVIYECELSHNEG